MIREIVLDTETTGTEARSGDRIIEIGCVELVNQCPTGKSFHAYVNPERPVSEGAFRVHGLSDAFLADKPVFAKIAANFRNFIDGARLVIHNAAFDVGFINMEFGKLGWPALDAGLVLDTLSMARRKHPGAANNLDALCARYGIDTTRRVKHGALLDAELLAEVYIELTGGKQADFGLSSAAIASSNTRQDVAANSSRPRPEPLPQRVTPELVADHAAFVSGSIGAKALWALYPPDSAQSGS